MKSPPRFLLIVSLVSIVSLTAVGIITWQILTYREHQKQQDCQQVVASRQDTRAMWLYLIDRATKQNPVEAQRFRVELDKLVPELKCVNGSWRTQSADS